MPNEEIKKYFQDNLLAISLKTTFNSIDKLIDYNGKKKTIKQIFTTIQALIRRRIERSAVAFVDGNYYLLLKDYHNNDKELDIKTIADNEINNFKKLLSEHFSNVEDIFTMKLVVKPFPIKKDNLEKHFINEEIDEQEILNDINEYVDELVIEVYNQFKESLMYKEEVMTPNGLISLEDTLKVHNELLHLDFKERKKVYKEYDFPRELVEEIEKKRALYYYLKTEDKLNKNQVLKPKVIKGFMMLKEKADFFYDISKDPDFKPQYDLILKTFDNINEYLKEKEEQKRKKTQ